MKQISKTQILLATAAVAVMFTIIITISVRKNHLNSTSNAITKVITHKKTPCINPPFPKANIAYSTYKIPANKDTTILHFTGTRIMIRANSFQNQAGQIIKGHIDLLYREMNNAWDIFASGIPMTYIKDTVEYQFESAGMFDIKGKQNGQTVSIVANKSIKVEMVSNNSENRFNNYYLDTIGRNWIDLGKNTINTTKITKAHKYSKNDTCLDIIALLPRTFVAPTKPLHVDSAKKIIKLIITNREKFPELNVFSDLSFEVIKDNNEFKPGKSDLEWHKPKIEQSELPDHYYLSMEGISKNKPKKNIHWLVRPAFQGKDYQTAVSIYREQYAEYKKEVANQEEMKRQIRLKQVADSIAYTKQEKEWELEQLKYAKTQKNIDKIYRTMMVANFGVYNADYPLTRKRGKSITPAFVDSEMNRIELKEIVLIDKSINGTFSYNLNFDKTIWIDQKSEQMLWGLANDTVLYVLKSKDLKELDFTRNSSTIPMERYSDVLKVKAKVKKFLM